MKHQAMNSGVAVASPGLDNFDTNELRLLGAREAGWRIDTTFLLEHNA
jgi:hypothetical protein